MSVLSDASARRATAPVFAAVFALAALAAFAGSARGDGTPGTFEPDCEGGVTIQGDQNRLSFTDPQGRDILGVCIKSGNMFDDGHSDALRSDGAVAGCYLVEGVSGTGATVTVTRTGAGSGCQGISHVDVIVGASAPASNPPSMPPSNPPSTPPSNPPSIPPSNPPSGGGTAASTTPPSRSGTLPSTGGPGGGMLPDTAVVAPLDALQLAGAGLLVAIASIGVAEGRLRR